MLTRAKGGGFSRLSHYSPPRPWPLNQFSILVNETRCSGDLQICVVSMLAILYWVVLSVVVISLSHHLYTNMCSCSSPTGYNEDAMRAELTDYVNSFKK